MTTAPLCPHCRNPVPADAPQGLCLRCLLHDVLSDSGEPDRARAEAVLARRLEQYRLVRFAGRGGMGEVWILEHVALGRKAALKLLSPAVIATPGFAERFLREAKAMAELNHPHILALYDFGECDGEFFLVMEYADSNLRSKLEADARDWPHPFWRWCVDDVVRWFLPVCEAVQHVHDRGMIHRDLKPENLLWVDDKLKLADFGLARSAAATDLLPASGPAPAGWTSAGHVLGTPDYMAPEQWKNPRDVDQRTDVYALGLILYEMLTGQRPRGHYPPPSTRARRTDRRLDDIVAKALASDPADRYPSAQRLRADLEAVVNRPVREAVESDIGWVCIGAALLVLGFLAVIGWGKSVACHALLGGVILLAARPWYFPWGPRLTVRVGCVACLFFDLVGPLFGLPPLVERFPVWHPAAWALAVAELGSILIQTALLELVALALHKWLFPKDWVFWGQVGSPGVIQPGLPFRATRLLAALLAVALGGVAVVGYWNEGLAPVWRWLPFTFAVLVVPLVWASDLRRTGRPVPPVVETPPAG
jgi:hypothetical protein